MHQKPPASPQDPNELHAQGFDSEHSLHSSLEQKVPHQFPSARLQSEALRQFEWSDSPHTLQVSLQKLSVPSRLRHHSPAFAVHSDCVTQFCRVSTPQTLHWSEHQPFVASPHHSFPDAAQSPCVLQAQGFSSEHSRHSVEQ